MTDTWKQMEIMPGCLPDWIDSQPSFSRVILRLVADRIKQWKQRLQGTNLEVNGVIILKPLRCVVNIYFIMLC